MTSASVPSWWRRALGEPWWHTVLYLLVCAAVLASAWSEPGRTPAQWVALALGALAMPVAVMERRRLPEGLVVLAMVMALVTSDALLPTGVFTLTVHQRSRRTWVTLLLAAVVAALAVWSPLAGPPTNSTVIATDEAGDVELPGAVRAAADVVLLVALPALAGAYLGTHRAMVASLRERAEQAERERELRAERAVLAERSRIASEMHDAVGHKLALLNLQVGALEVSADAGAQEVARQCVALRTTTAQASAELRSLLDVLRVDPTVPQPGIGDVPGLLTQAQEAGAEVRALVDAEQLAVAEARLAPVLSRAVYRLVQESVSNALRHAPGQPVTVALEAAPGRPVTLVVTNPLPEVAGETSRSGLGVEGLRERTRVVGGRIDVGPDRDASQWRVAAELPWREETGR